MLDDIKAFFDTPSLFTILVSLVVVAFLVQWFVWLFGLGRFKPSLVSQRASETSPVEGTARQTPIRHVVANLFVKVVDDFRHLLALILVIIFAVTLIYSLAVAANTTDDISKALQAVTGSLSGIIGVVIGYYFGESAGKRSAGDPPIPISIEPGDDDQADPAPGVVVADPVPAVRRSGKQPAADATLPRSPPGNPDAGQKE